MPRAVALLVAIAAAPYAAPAQIARDSTRADSATRQLQTVSVTESRAVGTIGGASAVVVRPDELRSSPAPLLEQALRESPFVLVRQNSRGEMELSVRGSDSRQAAVLLDGVPLSLGWDHRTDPSLVPITGGESIVIVRGLSSLLNGPNTLGGTIEIEHERPGRARARGSAGWLGSSVDRDAAYVLTAGGGRAASSVALKAGITHRKRDGFRVANGVSDTASSNGLRTNSDSRQVDGFVSARWAGDAGRSLGLTVTAFDARRGVPPELHISNPRLWRYPCQSRVVAAMSGQSGRLATPLGFATVDAAAGYNAGRSKLESYSNLRYQTVVAEELGDERTATGRLLARHSFYSGAELRGAVTAADVRYTETLSPAAGDNYRQLLWSAGSEVDMPVGNRVSLVTGIVYDHAATPLTGGRPSQAPFAAWGVRGGVTGRVSPELRLHASASRRSRFPALRELYSGALNRFEPSPGLRPETLLGVEAGMTLDRELGPIPDVTVQAVAFHHNLDDAVVRVAQPDRRFKRVNRDRIRSTGLELLAGMASGINADRSVSLTGDALIQRIAVIDLLAANAQRHAENQPEARAMLELGIPLPLALRATTNARFTGRQYCVHPDLGEQTLAPQGVVDVATQRRFRLSGSAFTELRAVIALDNVADRAMYDQCGLPQPGRSIRLGIRLR